MKRIIKLIIFMLLISLYSNAQIEYQIGTPNRAVRVMGNQYIDSNLFLGIKLDTLFRPNRRGVIIVRSLDSLPYYWNAFKWQKMISPTNNVINGSGFVKANGNIITYDPNLYITSGTVIGNTPNTSGLTINTIGASKQLNLEPAANGFGGVISTSNQVMGSGEKYFNGKVGINNLSPASMLSVNGDADISGNVGIGTTSPTAKLHVVGSVKMPSLSISSTVGDSMVVKSPNGQLGIRVINNGESSNSVNLLGNIIKDSIESTSSSILQTFSNNTASVSYGSPSMLERWVQKTQFKITSGLINGGIGIGIKSSNVLDPAPNVGWVIKGSSTIKMLIGGGYTNKIYDSLVVSIGFSNNDSGYLEFERVVDTLYLTFKNITTNELSVLKSTISNGNMAHNTGMFSVFNFGGIYLLKNTTVDIKEVVGANLMLIGDSKLAFGYVNNGRERLGELLSGNFPYTVISGGGADKTTEVLLRLDEIKRLNPKQVIFSTGCNDLRGGLIQAQYETNYRRITDSLVSWGIKVYHQYYYEGVETFQPTQVAFLKATYPTTYINTYDALKDYNGSLTNAHPNVIGNKVIYNTTINSFKLLGSVNKLGTVKDLNITIGKDNIITNLNNNYLWFRTPTKLNEDIQKTSKFIIGDDTTCLGFVTPPGGIDHQKNANLLISKKQVNNNENVALFSMTTSDAPSKNGFSFFNFTTTVGLVIPRLETYSLGATGYQHDTYTKYNSSGVLFTIKNYDSLNLLGQTTKEINPSSNIFQIRHASNNVFNILGNGNVGIGTITPTSKLHVVGKGLFTDTLDITTMGASDNSNRAASTAFVKNQGYTTKSFFTGGDFDINSTVKLRTKKLTITDTVGGIITQHQYNYDNSTPLRHYMYSSSNPNINYEDNYGLSFRTSLFQNNADYSTLQYNSVQEYKSFYNDNTSNFSEYISQPQYYKISLQKGASTINYSLDSSNFSIKSGVTTKFNVDSKTGVITSSKYANSVGLDSVLSTDATGNFINIAKSSISGGGSGANIYNTNGTLTGARRLNGNGYLLKMDSAKLSIADTSAIAGHLYDFNNGASFVDYNSTNVSSLVQTEISGVKFSTNDRNNLDTSNNVWVKPDKVELNSTNRIDINSRTFYPATYTTPGTTGNQTINKNSGSVNIAAAATSITITNNLVTANTIVIPTIGTNDATAVIANIVCTAGSFTINMRVPATNETIIKFWITN